MDGYMNRFMIRKSVMHMCGSYFNMKNAIITIDCSWFNPK